MKTEPSREKLLGIAQAARILGMHYVTVGRLVRQGILQGSKTENGHWVVPEADVIRYAAALRAAKEPH
jgi:predicted site-specific integrase-resolvase